jgi:drug/metabolite transporter (DMT)-like permease
MPPRLGVLLAIVFWGISFVATKAVLAEISPLALIFARAGLATLFLSAALALRGISPFPPGREIGPLALMGFVGVAFHQTLQAEALTLTSAVNTGWLVGLTPIWSALLAAWMLKEPFGRVKLLGLALGFLGGLLVVTQGSAASLALPSTRGDVLILFSTLNWALYTVLGHSTLRRLGATRAIAGSMLCGSLMLAPVLAFFGGFREYAQLSGAGWAGVLFLGIACSGLGYLFWFGALEHIEASRVASFLYIEPLVTLAAAALMLHEPISAVTVIGGCLLIGGVVLVQNG